jgi:hypothetical protein
MDNLPSTVRTPEQERLVSAIVNLPLVSPDHRPYLHVRDGPREVTFEVSLDIRQRKFEAFQGIAFRFYVMFDQIGKAFVLAARLDVPSAREIKKVLPERCSIGLFPTRLDSADYCDQLFGIIVGIRIPDQNEPEDQCTARQ